jgi:hypothetical protein
MNAITASGSRHAVNPPQAVTLLRYLTQATQSPFTSMQSSDSNCLTVGRCNRDGVSETTRLLIGEVLKNVVGTLIDEMVVQMAQCLANNERSAGSRPSRGAQSLSQTISDRHFFVIQADGQKSIPSATSEAIRDF